MKLTPKQEKFAQGYVETGNASEAYRRAYNTAKMKPESVNRLAIAQTQHKGIAARIRELQAKLLAKHEVTVDRVIAEYSKLAFLDIRKAFDADGNLKQIHKLDDETAAAIAGLEFEEVWGTGSTDAGSTEENLEPQAHGGSLKRRRVVTGRLHKIKLSDKLRALEALAKHLGMFIEKHEITGADGGPIQGELTVKFVKP